MRLKELELLKEYAVGSNDYPRKAIVTKIGVHREVWRAGSFRLDRSRRADGVEVTCISMADGSLGEIEVVAASKVRCTWAEELERRDARQARRDREQQQFLDTEAIRDALMHHGLDARLSFSREDGVVRNITITIAAAKRIIKKLDELEDRKAVA